MLIQAVAMKHWLILRCTLNKLTELKFANHQQLRPIGFLPVIFLYALPQVCYAHAFDERYDLPIPLSFFIWGAVLTVASTYLLAILLIRKSGPSQQSIARPSSANRVLFCFPIVVQHLIQVMAVFDLCFLMTIAFFGPDNPLMNMTSHFVWVNWWVGVPLLFAIFGPMMLCIDPFSAISRVINTRSSSSFAQFKIKLAHSLGRWPAVIGLLCWCWIEVIYPNAALPHYLGTLIMLWMISGLLGRQILGAQEWNAGWDFFRIYFINFGRISPLSFRDGAVYLGKPFARLIEGADSIHGDVAFIIAMLSTVLFDGLHSSPLWLSFQELFQGKFDANGYFSGLLGVILVWAIFYLCFVGACFLVTRKPSLRENNKRLEALYIAEIFAPTLIPIALAYHVAHNFSSLIIQGQNIIPLMSDPFGMGWNLFGTANFYPNIAVLDAKTVWYIALSSIVIGHVVSIYLAHLVALKEFKTVTAASRAALPLTLLMIAFTAISLMILAEPLTN